jgi:uroporphyrinogen-III decarboxylase
MSLSDDPKFLEELVEITVDFDVKAINRMAKAGVDAMILSDDYGTSAQVLLRPEQFKALYKPELKKIIDCIKDINLPASLPCCGRVHDFLDDLVKIGIDAYQPVKRPADMNLATVKNKHGDRICLVGTSILPGPCPLELWKKLQRRRARRCASPHPAMALSSPRAIRSTVELR